MKKRVSTFVFLIVLMASLACAQPNDAPTDHSKYDPIGVTNVTLIGFLALGLFALIAMCAGEGLSEFQKKALFILLTLIVVGVTVYFVGSTLYKNFSSVTKGPIHWHLDYEIYNCGQQVDLIDPTGMSNKVGSSVFHEHNDNRIHIEGVVIKHSDINLKNYFAIVGGMLEKGLLKIPTNNGEVVMQDGALCNGQPATLQAFLFKTTNPKEHNNWFFVQEKLENYPDYVMSQNAVIPPGDCIIFEFGPEKATTDHLCETYEVALRQGDAHGS